MVHSLQSISEARSLLFLGCSPKGDKSQTRQFTQENFQPTQVHIRKYHPFSHSWSNGAYFHCTSVFDLEILTMKCMIARVLEVTHPYRIYKPLVSASVSLDILESR